MIDGYMMRKMSINLRKESIIDNLTRGHFAKRGDMFKVYGEKYVLRYFVGRMVHYI